MRTKTGRDLPIEQVTAENYIVPKGEEMSYHAKIEVKQFNPKTGVRISVPRIQIFGRKIFESVVRDSLAKQGYEVEILHDPTKWIAEQQERIVQSKAAAKAAEKAALKAEIMAELKSAGIIPGEDAKKAGRPKKEQE